MEKTAIYKAVNPISLIWEIKESSFPISYPIKKSNKTVDHNTGFIFFNHFSHPFNPMKSPIKKAISIPIIIKAHL